MLQRAERSFEHRFGQGADEVAATRGDLTGPALVGDAGWAMPFVERIESVRHAMPEHDCLPTDRFGDGSVFALRVAGYVDAAAEGDRACVEALHER